MLVVLGYLHQVRSFGRGISYTVQFAPALTFESTDCKDTEPKGKRKRKDKKEKESTKEETKLSLADVEFVWTYQNGMRVRFMSTVCQTRSFSTTSVSS